MLRILKSSHFLLQCGFLAAALFLWGIAYTVGSVIVDGFQSIGSISAARIPLSLHWPLVGDYLGYDQTWGFHWPGWPLLRSMLLPVLAWSPAIDLLLLSLIWVAAAWLVSKLAESNSPQASSTATGFLTLLAPGVVITLQNYRPEIITALLLLIALRYWNESTRAGRVLLGVVLLVLPLTHPLGLVVPAAWLTWGLFLGWRGKGLGPAIQAYKLQILTLAVGLLLFVLWFALQPQAWEQFQTNIEAQRLLSKGMEINHLTFFRWMFGRITSLTLAILLLVSIWFGCCLCYSHVSGKCDDSRDNTDHSSMTLAGLAVIAAFLFNWLVKNANSHHLMSVMPMMIWLFVCAVRRWFGSVHSWLPTVACVILLGLSNALLAKYVMALIKQGGKSYRAGLTQALHTLPSARKVWIPVAFWEAAQIASRENPIGYQFSTFPNVLERSKRVTYEMQVMTDMQSGDLLIWDPLQEQGGVFNFVEITALRHVLINPHDESQWEKMDDIHVTTQYSRGQAVHFETYRKR